MKLISWNVNGIRSVFRKGFLEWLEVEDPDIVCLQEVKGESGELPKECLEIDGYYAYFNSSSRRKGHSGVAVYSKVQPLKVESRFGIERFDDEGRGLKLTFDDFVLFNFYIPNGTRDKRDVPYKLEVYKQLFSTLKPFSDTPTILAGDFNIAHTEQDVFYAKQNQNNTMFTPEEREQITALIDMGYVDTFRHLYPDTESYTWWPYAHNLRECDRGWRIDYIFVSDVLLPTLRDAFMRRDTGGSDHVPCGVTLNKEFVATERPIYPKEATQKELF